MSGFYWDSANPTPVIEFSLSEGAFTVSTSGVCKVLFPKQGSPGLMQELDLSGRSYTIASGAMIGRHGTTPSVAWGSAMPLFVYLVNSNNTAAGVQISLSRDPRASLTPASEDNIGIAGSAAAVSAQGNHFQSGTAKLENVPCLCIGSLTATIDNSAGGVFTFGALSSTDGFGKFQEGVTFTFPLGQNSCVANTAWFSDASADVPTYATPASIWAFYSLDRDGILHYVLDTTSAGNCTQDGGAGAVAIKFGLPLAPLVNTSGGFAGVQGWVRANGVTYVPGVYSVSTDSIGVLQHDSNAVLENVWGDNSADDVYLVFTVRTF